MKNPLSLQDSDRVIRGGFWHNALPPLLRPAERDSASLLHRYTDIGFRIFRTQEKK